MPAVHPSPSSLTSRQIDIPYALRTPQPPLLIPVVHTPVVGCMISLCMLPTYVLRSNAPCQPYCLRRSSPWTQGCISPALQTTLGVPRTTRDRLCRKLRSDVREWGASKPKIHYDLEPTHKDPLCPAIIRGSDCAKPLLAGGVLPTYWQMVQTRRASSKNVPI